MKTKIRKSLVTALILFAICLFFVSILYCAHAPTSAYAEEITAPEESVVVSETPAISEDNTFFGVIFKWCQDNIVPILSTANLGTIIGVIVAIRREIKDNKKHKEEITSETATNTQSNSDAISAMNTLIAKYNDFETYIKELIKTEMARNPQFQEITAYGKATLEILSAVYANNKNIPQAVKDLVQLKYVGALKDVAETVESASDESAGSDL